MSGLKRILLLAALSLAACTSTPQTWNSTRTPSSLVTDADNDLPNINEGLSPSDFKILVSTALKGLDKKCSAAPRNLPHMISTFESQVAGDLDLPLLERELSDQLHNAGYSIVDKRSREDIATEESYESAGFTNPSQKIVSGRQVGIVYLIRTVIASQSQQTDDTKFTKYRLSLEVVSSELSEVVCVGESTIKKQYSRKKVAF